MTGSLPPAWKWILSDTSWMRLQSTKGKLSKQQKEGVQGADFTCHA
jgi:hypothetical protein